MEAVINSFDRAAVFITNQTVNPSDSPVFLDQTWTTVYSLFFLSGSQVAVAFYVAWSLDFIEKSEEIQKQYRVTVFYNWVYNFSLACFFGILGVYLLVHEDSDNEKIRTVREFPSFEGLEIVGGSAKFEDFEQGNLFEKKNNDFGPDILGLEVMGPKTENIEKKHVDLSEISRNKVKNEQMEELAALAVTMLYFLCKLSLWSFSVFATTLPLLKLIQNTSRSFKQSRSLVVRMCATVTVLLAIFDSFYFKVWFVWPIQKFKNSFVSY